MNLQEDSLLQGGKYKIEKILGQGGFGLTYLAKQKIVVAGGIGKINTTYSVAIKEFFMKDLCDRDSNSSQVSVGSSGSRELVDKFKAKFIKEAQSIAGLEHENIIKVLDVFEENGTAYYVMEYIDGGSLGDRVSQSGAMPEVEALHYIGQIADALRYIHSRKINHLDIKPGNILLREGAVSVLIDFGLAKQYDQSGEQTSSTPVGISSGYAPMEQYKAGGVSSFSPSTDIYSLGATLYKCITGETPPEAYDIFANGLPALPSSISQSTKAAITSAMQIRREDRPESIEEFLSLLGISRESSEQTVLLDLDKKVVSEPQVERSPKADSRQKAASSSKPKSSPMSEAKKENSDSSEIYIKRGYTLCAVLAFVATAVANIKTFGAILEDSLFEYEDLFDLYIDGYTIFSLDVVYDDTLLFLSGLMAIPLSIAFISHMVKRSSSANGEPQNIKIRKTLGGVLIQNPYLNIFFFYMFDLYYEDISIIYIFSLLLLLGYFANIYIHVKDKVLSKASFRAGLGVILVIAHNFIDGLNYADVAIVHSLSSIGYVLIALFFIRLYLLQSKNDITPNLEVVEKM
ncbi:MAG: serine/threonine-protein kinase [Rikenellaceae bacterium]